MNKDIQRELTPDEAKRNEYFENQKAQLEKEGYKTEDLTTSVVKSNIMAILMTLPFIVFFTIIYVIVNNTKIVTLISDALHFETFFSLLLLLAVIFLLAIAHELIHGVSRAAFAKSGWKAISFGFIKKYMTPYCTCNEPLTKFGYIVGALMPTIVLGIIPAIVAVAIANTHVFYIAMLMILAGGGDMFVTYKLMIFKANGKNPYI